MLWWPQALSSHFSGWMLPPCVPAPLTDPRQPQRQRVIARLIGQPHPGNAGQKVFWRFQYPNQAAHLLFDQARDPAGKAGHIPVLQQPLCQISRKQRRIAPFIPGQPALLALSQDDLHPFIGSLCHHADGVGGQAQPLLRGPGRVGDRSQEASLEPADETLPAGMDRRCSTGRGDCCLSMSMGQFPLFASQIPCCPVQDAKRPPIPRGVMRWDASERARADARKRARSSVLAWECALSASSAHACQERMAGRERFT
jgi:hypothetical protein